MAVQPFFNGCYNTLVRKHFFPAVTYIIHMVQNIINHLQQLQKVQGVLSHQEDHEGPKREKQRQERNISCIEYKVLSIKTRSLGQVYNIIQHNQLTIGPGAPFSPGAPDSPCGNGDIYIYIFNTNLLHYMKQNRVR